MDVFEKGVGRPSAIFFDCNGVDAIEFHCHGSPGSEGVATDIVVGEPVAGESHLVDRVFDHGVDMGWGDLVWVMMGKIKICANGSIRIGGVLRKMRDASG